MNESILAYLEDKTTLNKVGEFKLVNGELVAEFYFSNLYIPITKKEEMRMILTSSNLVLS